MAYRYAYEWEGNGIEVTQIPGVGSVNYQITSQDVDGFVVQAELIPADQAKVDAVNDNADRQPTPEKAVSSFPLKRKTPAVDFEPRPRSKAWVLRNMPNDLFSVPETVPVQVRVNEQAVPATARKIYIPFRKLIQVNGLPPTECLPSISSVSEKHRIEKEEAEKLHAAACTPGM